MGRPTIIQAPLESQSASEDEVAEEQEHREALVQDALDKLKERETLIGAQIHKEAQFDEEFNKEREEKIKGVISVEGNYHHKTLINNMHNSLKNIIFFIRKNGKEES